jgi:hypothetical protein
MKKATTYCEREKEKQANRDADRNEPTEILSDEVRIVQIGLKKNHKR